jgi:multidrug transporter EmrE-like cation transporter
MAICKTLKNFNLVDHIYIFATLFFSLYSQLIIRWQVSSAGELPNDFIGKFYFLLSLLFNPWIFSAILSTFLSGLSWLLVMSKFEISYAYPWISLSYIFIFLFGIILFNESITPFKVFGMIFLIIGIYLISRS